MAQLGQKKLFAELDIFQFKPFCTLRSLSVGRAGRFGKATVKQSRSLLLKMH